MNAQPTPFSLASLVESYLSAFRADRLPSLSLPHFPIDYRSRRGSSAWFVVRPLHTDNGPGCTAGQLASGSSDFARLLIGVLWNRSQAVALWDGTSQA
jgi:hypothetical protein